MSRLRRYELTGQAEQPFDRLSGGQQARFQILLLELEGVTALLLDEPTDNLDLESAEALQEGLEAFEGTVLAVTHDRWFARSFDRYLVFGSDGRVRETAGAGVGRAAGGARPRLGAPVRGPGRASAFGGPGPRMFVEWRERARDPWLPPGHPRW